MKIFTVIVTRVTHSKGSKNFAIVDKMACFALGRDLVSDT